MSDDNYYVMDENGRLSQNRRPALRRAGNEPPTVTIARPRPGQNPALAFTYSLLCWGGGQLHNQQVRLGVVFILFMAAFYICLALAFVERHELSGYLHAYQISGSKVAKIFFAIYFSGIVLWAANAMQAYKRARKGAPAPFEGVKMGPIPALASLLVPGWGQFLNGQGIKGTAFILGFTGGLFAAGMFMATPVFWPHLEAAPDRLFWETVLLYALAGSVLYLICLPLSVYDALRVSLDQSKKESLLKRLNYAWNRRKVLGWRRGVMPQFRSTIVLTLILSISLLICVHYLPGDYYVAKVRQVSRNLQAMNMTLIPRFAARFLRAVGDDSSEARLI